ncbi:thioredoxin family protein [Elizabethkingia meningoseptica]|uniref:thioredoxin family protein n=1 Tax=Elizabethkingia meningoseptica TaxID=238 RepID=UPI0022F18251|nr:thioredoxin family protein [Elizabethkingia meningoseptica]EJK5327461.1 thioredoxin family protein [Elizabethkingia meningoseptica]MDE5436670.1 thioredoxin family protein [Elizabethkingia meningoseptica]MDE5467096.1 thioredoxin family protein [Elizabethkingia meningoseptica]MDE5473674.1 thioredoxin family protein [Elizabethkingia meningoseptica]MDE5477107.1 thioredoxin family protein [Elizabethkingia meningoseptica]
MNKIIKTIGLSLVVLSTAACGQKKEETKVTEVTKSTVISTVTDSAKVKEEAKKAAIAEKNALPKPYHPEENAEAKIAELIKQAQKENKNIMIQAGGNWCIWCLRFNNFVQTTPELKKQVDDNYVYYHLNYSPDNKNEKIFAKYGNPGAQYGYPVFIVLDKNGKQIHTQDSSVLEEGKGYSIEKVKKFFDDWKPKA